MESTGTVRARGARTHPSAADRANYPGRVPFKCFPARANARVAASGWPSLRTGAATVLPGLSSCPWHSNLALPDQCPIHFAIARNAVRPVALGFNEVPPGRAQLRPSMRLAEQFEHGRG